MDNSKQFNQEIDRIVRAIDIAIKDVAVLSADAFDKNFANQSFFGRKWKPSKYTMDNKGKSRHLLHKTGALRMSIKYTILNNVITFRSAVPYANIHNEGGTINHPGGTAYIYDKKKKRSIWISNYKASGKNYPRTKPHKIAIPKRQFIGNASQLEKLIENVILKQIK